MSKIFAVLSLLACVTGFATAQDTVHVKAGWNNIGAVAAGAINEVVCTDPPGIITTDFFKYNPGEGYATDTTLEKGVGYWVKVSSDGIIIFNGTCGGVGGVCSVPSVSYEGEIYPTVAIGDQCWLTKNLNVGTMVTGVTDQTDNATTEKYCYNDDSVNCGVYGGLYQWNEAMQYSTTEGAQGICPPGWHIPTLAEFQTLSSTVGGDGNALKAVGQGSGLGAGTNTSGFSALLVGFRYDTNGVFLSLGSNAYFWSSWEYDAAGAVYLPLNYSSSDVLLYDGSKNYGFSVRCLKN